MLLSILLPLSGCMQRVEAVRTVRGPEKVQRRVAPDQASPVRIRWFKTGNKLTGRLSWGMCVVERSWTETEQRVERREANERSNNILTIAGTTALLGAAAWHGVLLLEEPEYECNSFGCRENKPSLVAPLLLAGAGAALTFGGILGNKRKPSERVLSSSSERKQATDRAICARRAVLADLEVALESSDGTRVSSRVDDRGLVRFDLPETMTQEIARERELVVRAVDVPAGAANLISAGQQLGTVAPGMAHPIEARDE